MSRPISRQVEALAAPLTTTLVRLDAPPENGGRHRYSPVSRSVGMNESSTWPYLQRENKHDDHQSQVRGPGNVQSVRAVADDGTNDTEARRTASLAKQLEQILCAEEQGEE